MDLTKEQWPIEGHSFVPIAAKWLASGTAAVVADDDEAKAYNKIHPLKVSQQL